jgi:peptide/nickel transport system substrate-binding protein
LCQVDVAYDLDAPSAEELKRDPRFRVTFSGGIGTFYLDFIEQWDPKSPWHDKRVRLAANYALDRQAISEAERLGASPPIGNIIPQSFDFAANYLGAVGIKVKLRTMERAAHQSARAAKQLRGLCVCASGRYGNAATRIEESVVSNGVFAWGGYPDIDALFKQQDVETDRTKRQAILYQIQELMHERVMFGPIWLYFWPSGIGSRVEEPAMMLINPYPWAAPLEDVRLKKG